MGRGRGGYTEKQPSYKDSGGYKVTDKGAIFVAERYMDQGYEAVFRRRHDPDRGCDLTIKTSDDENIVKNIEVKAITSNNPSKMSTRIGEAAGQISEGDTYVNKNIGHWAESAESTQTNGKGWSM